ncbi:MAG TPA: hypothetical protein VIG51_08145, partial [Candidatus Baltobacteraceae bacterium]
RALAAASTADVLRLWQGLGYNSRAVRLKQIAEAVIERFAGVIPDDAQTLRALPGMGPYTVSALRAFAFDCDDAATDVNVRRVCHRLSYGVEYPARVSAAQLDVDARALVPAGRGHDWNSAMMDLGATICTARAPKCLLCPLQTACAAAPIDPARLDMLRKQHGRKPSPQEAMPFEQTTRFARGRIVDRLRGLPAGQRISLLELHRDMREVLRERSPEEVGTIVAALMRDGLIEERNGLLALVD